MIFNTFRGWGDYIKGYFKPRVVTMLFLGFSAGIPLLLIFSSLSLWLREAGVDRSTTTFFSWAALGYSFKFVWAPLIDKLPLPILTRVLGHRRAWLLVAQLAVISSIVWMASIDPSSGENSLNLMGFAAVCLGFSAATQDIVIDAFRIEVSDTDPQALLSTMYITGYRIAMVVSGAGALFLAEYFGSTSLSYSYSAWGLTYLCMAAVMLVGVFTTFHISEPELDKSSMPDYRARDYAGLLGLFLFVVFGFVMTYYLSSNMALLAKQAFAETFSFKQVAGVIVELGRLILALSISAFLAMSVTYIGVVNRSMVQDTYIKPVLDLFERFSLKPALLLLLLIGLYRISDILLGVISNVFYQDIGFTKSEIGAAVKTFGLIMTLVGGFVGGMLSIRFGVVRMLFIGALLSAVTNLLFMLLAQAGNNLLMFYLVVAADNISAGLASAAFIAFLSNLTNISFTAMQYAIFSSIMTLLPKVLGGFSGSMVESIGYINFFLLTTVMGLPVLLLIWLTWSNVELYMDNSQQKKRG